MNKILIPALNRTRYLLACLLILGVQLLPFGNIWQNKASAETIAPNPSLTQSCGLNIALVLDNSSSISSSELRQMKDAMYTFVDALSATPTIFSVSRFSSSASVLQNFTSNYAAVKSSIESIPRSEGTNWQDGLIKGNGTFSTIDNDKPNLILFATDGQPTASNGQPTGMTHHQRAIHQANIVKNGGTRIVPIGIGMYGDDPVEKLKSISGTVTTGPIQNRDLIITDNFATLAQDLANWAKATCGGTITAEKIIDVDGNPNTKGDQSIGNGWNFNVAGWAETTDQYGKTKAVRVDAGSGYSVQEATRNDHELTHAECTGATKNGVFNKGTGTINGIEISDTDVVSCKFYNRPTTGSLVVNKIVNKGPSANHPEHFSFSVLGNNYTFESDGSNTISKLPEGTKYTVQEINVPANYKVEYSEDCTNATIIASQVKTCTITNTYIAPPELIVTKHAINNNGGTVEAKDFSLFVNNEKLSNPSSVVSGIPNSSATYNKTLVTGASYDITEAKVQGYQNTYITCRDITSSDTDNAPVLELPFVAHGDKKYRCDIGNDDIAPKLTVTKIVNNQWGGTKEVKDFSLFVNGNSVTSGDQREFNTGSAAVSENQLEGYIGVFSGDCGQDGKLLLALGGVYNCTITNNAQPGKLIVKKNVINDNGGTKKANDFRFNISGHEKTYRFNKDGEAEILVANGKYTVTEVADPEYKPSYNNCTDLVIPNGVTVTCTITNDDIAPRITVSKAVRSLNELDMETTFDFTLTNSSDFESSFELSHHQKRSFKNLDIGLYTITEDEKNGWFTDEETTCYIRGSEGWISTEGTAIDAQLGKEYHCRFVNKKYSSISGYKFNDLDGSGTWDKESEPTIANWSITLQKENCPITDNAITDLIENGHSCEDQPTQETTATQTDEAGKYSFNSLKPGTYNVCEIQQAGWTKTHPSDECHSIEIGYGTDKNDINFGNKKDPEPETGGGVLGTSTSSTPPKLANTGSQSINTALIALLIISLTAITGFLFRQEES